MGKNNEVKILDYNHELHHSAFRQINIDWIRDKFIVEEIDEEVLANPHKYILNNGGCILMAEYQGNLVGTCSLINEGDDVYELTKMGVDKNYRGLKIGQLLGEAALQKAKELGAKKLMLHSNREGSAAAIELYKKLGFIEVPMGNVQWKRANIQMEIEF